MIIEKMKLDDMVSPEWNPRDITPEDMEKLKRSLNDFGYVDPIIINKVNNHIVGGNQRYFALKELGYTEIDVVFIDEPDLNKEKALNIALNKITGDWDFEKLPQIIDELSISGLDIELTGFDDLELKELIGFNEDLGDEDFIDDAPTDFSEDFRADPLDWQDRGFYLVEGDEWDLGAITIKVNKPNPEDYFKILISYDDMKISAVKIPDTPNKIDEIIENNQNNVGLHRKGDEYFEYD